MLAWKLCMNHAVFSHEPHRALAVNTQRAPWHGICTAQLSNSLPCSPSLESKLQASLRGPISRYCLLSVAIKVRVLVFMLRFNPVVSDYKDSCEHLFPTTHSSPS
ncbi:hypothetical protein K431DRAFT_289672 [Polychaeton citri CBS 116435]|uniref:Uncharacterized protein n=1 Tax=Polychaeton citri CBS 116435 TaxID=1314669 RepID=A0A9P4UHT8_9PEZI|nr:hypothetical protein K431DRAFT_289672 [Polychaeton citri CBS 116435]